MAWIRRVVFFGTPEFAVPTLEALVAAGRPPALVVSQPDRPAGRGQRLASPPVATRARALALPVAQVERVREPGFLAELVALAPDLAIVVAFGQVFPPALLSLPAQGCINLHASLLPRWRGAAPIQAAIAAGDVETGVTTMRMEAGLDSGPILLQQPTAIGERETAGELAVRLAVLGAKLVLATVAALERDEIAPRPQDPALVTVAPKAPKGRPRVDWSEPATAIDRHLRAASPIPGLGFALDEEEIRLLAGRPLGAQASTDGAAPGTVLGLLGPHLAVAAGQRSVFGIECAQRPGRRPVAARDLANGLHLEPGARLE